MPRKCPLCEVGAAAGNSRRPYFWRYINRGCSMCQECGLDWSRVRIIKMHACLRHGNDWATTTNIINKIKVTRDAAVYDGQNSRLLESDRVRVTAETYRQLPHNASIQFNSIQLYFQTHLCISYAQYRGPE